MCGCSKNIDYKKDVDRAQSVRLWDVFLIGPALIIAGLIPTCPKIIKIILIVIGVGTIGYNGYHYLKYRNANN